MDFVVVAGGGGGVGGASGSVRSLVRSFAQQKQLPEKAAAAKAENEELEKTTAARSRKEGKAVTIYVASDNCPTRSLARSLARSFALSINRCPILVSSCVSNADGRTRKRNSQDI